MIIKFLMICEKFFEEIHSPFINEITREPMDEEKGFITYDSDDEISNNLYDELLSFIRCYL